MIQCGQSIDVKEITGAFAVRFIAQCNGRFLQISHTYSISPRNGYMLPDWRSVVRELVALTVPASLAYERGRTAQSLTDGVYHDLALTYPLSISGMAGLLGENMEAVRLLLADLAVQAE